MAEPPRLLHFRVSHYNEKVRWALDHKGWAHRREAMLPGFHAPRARWLTGQQKLPILIVDRKPLIGSASILAEIERRKPDAPLYPEDPAQRARAAELERYFDVEVAPALRRLFWSTYFPDKRACVEMATAGGGGFARAVWSFLYPIFRPAMVRNMGAQPERVAQARKDLRVYLDRLESEIGPSGYLVGDCFGVADLATAAVMTAILRPPQFPYPLPEPWPAPLVEIRESVADHAATKWVLGIYEKHRAKSAEVAG